MKISLFSLIALVLFIVVALSATVFSNSNNSQAINTIITQSSSSIKTSNTISLKGFTLGAALPTFDRYNCNEEYYQNEKKVTVSGEAGNLTAIFYLESIGFEDYAKIIESRDDLEELTVDEYNRKWGVPIIYELEFVPDRAVLCSGHYVDGRFIYGHDIGPFAQNVSDYYSVKLKFDENEHHWIGERDNLRITLTASSFYLLDINLEVEIEHSHAEYKRKKALQKAKDF